MEIGSGREDEWMNEWINEWGMKVWMVEYLNRRKKEGMTERKKKLKQHYFAFHIPNNLSLYIIMTTDYFFFYNLKNKIIITSKSPQWEIETKNFFDVNCRKWTFYPFIQITQWCRLPWGEAAVEAVVDAEDFTASD